MSTHFILFKNFQIPYIFYIGTKDFVPFFFQSNVVVVTIERELASPVHTTSFYWLTLRQCTYYSDLWHSTQYRLYKTNGYEQFPEHIYYKHWVWKTIHVFPSFCVHTCLSRSCVRIPNYDLSWLRRYAPRCFALTSAWNISY